MVFPLARAGDDTWFRVLPEGALPPGGAFRLSITGPGGVALKRRDPYARVTDYGSAWCVAPTDASAFEWRTPEWAPPPFDEYIIYELHVGSWTHEGTLAAAAARLGHVRALGFTAIELMPLCKHSDAWGYNPRQLLALSGAYGGPDDMRRFVDAAHGAGLAVIVDVVLNHGAPDGNTLWDFDRVAGDGGGGTYHEGAADTPWGRSFAFWKREVVRYMGDACAMWLGEYRVDGAWLRSMGRLRKAGGGGLLCGGFRPTPRAAGVVFWGRGDGESMSSLPFTNLAHAHHPSVHSALGQACALTAQTTCRAPCCSR